MLLLSACSARRAELVRIDFERVIARLPQPVSAPAPKPSVAQGALAAHAELPAVEAPATPDTLNRRREQARDAIREQREAVRERLLQIRLEPLEKLEQQWRAELQAEYDPDSIRAQWLTEWRAAFEKHGRRRLPLLTEMAQLSPNSERYRQLQQQLNALDDRWRQQDQALRQQLQARLQRVEQEIEARLRARRREFIRQVEQEVDQLMRQQPDLIERYMPPAESRQAPAKRLQVPALSVGLPGDTFGEKVQQSQRAVNRLTQRILREMAREWARMRGYRLSDSPSARDATDEFIDYLEFRR